MFNLFLHFTLWPFLDNTEADSYQTRRLKKKIEEENGSVFTVKSFILTQSRNMRWNKGRNLQEQKKWVLIASACSDPRCVGV